MEEKKDKFDEAEIVIGFLGFLLIDLACAAADIISVGITAVTITPVIQFLVTYFGIERWVESKGGTYSGIDVKRLLKYASNLLPAIPTLVFIFAVEVLLHNKPELAAAVGKIAGGVAGGAVAGPAGAKTGGALGGKVAQK